MEEEFVTNIYRYKGKEYVVFTSDLFTHEIDEILCSDGRELTKYDKDYKEAKEKGKQIYYASNCKYKQDVYVQVVDSTQMKYLLEKNRITKDCSIISIHNPGEDGIDFESYGKDIDYIKISFPNLDKYENSKEELDKYFTQKDALIDFITDRVYKCQTIYCQCDDGKCRSAGVAAAIFSYYAIKATAILYDKRFHPNWYLFETIEELLEQRIEGNNV